MTSDVSEFDDEKTTDENDRASQLEMLTTASAIHDVRQRVKRQQEVRADGTYEVTECDDCGLDIDPRRLDVAIMNRLCVYCCEAMEKRSRR